MRWQAFYEFRNDVLKTLRAFGTVGPMGERPITDADEPAFDEDWPIESESPDFFVVDDWWNDRQHFVVVETDTRRIERALLEAIWDMLSTRTDWAVSFLIDDARLLVFCDHLAFRGTRFEGCETVVDILVACQSR